MRVKPLSIVTATFNVVRHIEQYCQSVGQLDPEKFDWIVIDGNSTDGTAEYLEKQKERFSYYESAPDSGFYHALNKGIGRVTTPYYMVFGADDRPSSDLLEQVMPLLSENPALVLGAVRLMPPGRIKRPRHRRFHAIGWGQVVSHHSVGTVIRTNVHEKFGYYDTRFQLLADGLLLKRILASSERIVAVNSVFGEFQLGGMTSGDKMRSAVEAFLIQVKEGSNGLLQLFLLNLRVIRNLVSGRK